MGLSNNLGKLSNMITSTGSAVGIGQTSPSYTLDVTGSGRYNGSYAGHLLNVQNTNASYYSSTDYYDNTGTEKLIVGYGNASTGNALASKAIIYGTSGVGLNFYTNGSTTAKMVIDTSGNVGIGTSSPAYTLDVAGVTRITGVGNALILAKSGNYPSLGFQGATYTNVIESGDDYMDFYQSGTRRMRITSGGNVLVGTTDDTGNYKFKASGVIAAFGSNCSLLFQSRGAANTYEWYATGSTIYNYSSANGNILSINGTNGAYTALSDINKKKDFEASTIGLNEVLQLKPTLYRMKTDDESEPKQLGFIAQEVKDFIPQAYVESGEGKDIFIGLNYNPIIAALVKGMQEQNQIIEELSNRLNKAGL